MLIESENLDPGVIGLVTADNSRVIINSIYLDRGLETLLYKNYCLAQLNNGYDCMIAKDGDSLKVTKMTTPSIKRLRTGA